MPADLPQHRKSSGEQHDGQEPRSRWQIERDPIQAGNQDDARGEQDERNRDQTDDDADWMLLLGASLAPRRRR